MLRARAQCPSGMRQIQRDRTIVRGLKENVAALPPVNNVTKISLPALGRSIQARAHVTKISLRCTSQLITTTQTHPTQPMPGKMASIAIYAHIASKYSGKLDKVAAQEAISL